MNGKKAKMFRRRAAELYSKLSTEATYNTIEEVADPTIKKETVYLTVDCKRHFYKQMKANYVRGDKNVR